MLEEDKDILARTVYGEARGEYSRRDGGLASLIAVANVILNRFQYKRRFGRSIRDVCQKPFQFSCWNANDPNRLLLEKVSQDDPIFQICCDVAENTIRGKWPDLTRGSDHYHADYVSPSWAYGQKCQLKVGRHTFYRLEGK